MQAKFNRSMVLAATAMAAVLATPALAQDAGTEDDGAIVVTARRVEEKLQDVPISITVFNQAQIDNRNIVNAADLGTYTPSLSTNAKYGPEKASFVIRGFVQDLATQPSVGVYFADVVGPRSGGSTTSGGGVGIGAMFDLQNVQVLKGPQGTLFGRNTTGGAVLLVPRKPTGDLEGYLEGSLGDYDLRRVQGVINVPLADTFKVRLGIDRMTRDGYLRNHTNIGPKRLGDTDFISARLSIVAELTPDLENYTIASYSLSDNHGTVPRVVGCNPPAVASAAVATRAAGAYYCAQQLARQNARGDGWWDVENTQVNPKLRMETWQVINTTTLHASDSLTIKNIASYAEFRETTRYSLEGDAFLDAAGNPVYRLISLNNTPNYNNSSQSTWTEELQFQGNAMDGALTWQAGGYYEASNPIGFTSQFTSQLLSCANPFTFQCAASVPNPAFAASPVRGSISPPWQKTWFRSKGVYAQGTYDFNDKLSMTAGVRYTWDRMTHRYDQVSVGFTADNTPRFTCPNVVRLTPGSAAPIVIGSLAEHARCNVTFTSKSKKPTWLIDLDYKPVDDVMIYAKWARGYRAGGVASANILFETWEPEKVDTYEIGAKASFSGGVRGYFNIAGFYNDFRNQQIQAALIRSNTSPLIGGSAIINAGKSRIWGVEVDASATLFDSLKIDAGYTYLNTKVLDIVPPVLTAELAPFYSAITPTAFKGDPLGLSPKHRASVTATYTLPLDDSIGKISFGGTWVHTAKQVVSRATAIQFQTIRANDLVNLNASWTGIMGSPVDLAFFMTNVTNEAVPLNVNNAWNSFGMESQIVNQPRMWGVRMRYSFGQ